MDIQSKHVYIGVACASIAVIALSYYLTNKQQPRKKQQIDVKIETIISQELDHMNALEQTLVHKSSQFDLEYIDKDCTILTMQCLMNFFRQTQDLFNAKEIQQIYQKSRQGRRKLFPQIQNQYEQYFKFVCSFDQEITYLIQRTQKDFVIFLNIDYEIVTNSVQHHLGDDKFRQLFSEWTSETREIIKNQLPNYNKPVDKNRLTEIMEFQIENLKANKNKLVEMVSKLGLRSRQQLQFLPTFFTCFLEDSLFEKYAIQYQQMNMQQFNVNLELQQKIDKFQQMQGQIISILYDCVKDDILQ